MKKIFDILPGFALAFFIYLVADYASDLVGKDLLGYKKSPISTVLFSIVFGILIGNFVKLGETFSKGITFSVKFVLRLGIILLGIRLSLWDVFKFGSISIPLIIICIVVVIIVVRFLITKLKISPEMSYLIAIGTSICGASAIVATAPVINAKKAEVTYAVANITIFGILGMFLYPYIANILFDGNTSAIGLFVGTAIHETAQVAASGLIYEQQFNDPRVLEVSTITKLVRNTFLIVMIPLFAYFYNRNSQAADYSITKIFPFFVVGYIMMVILRTAGDHLILNEGLFIDTQTWGQVINLLKEASGICLSVAMAALGLSTNFKEIKTMGHKPFVVGFIAAFVVGFASLLTILGFQGLGLVS